MNKDLAWDKFENAKIERAKAEVAEIKARRAADIADQVLSKARATETEAYDAWRATLTDGSKKSAEGME